MTIDPARDGRGFGGRVAHLVLAGGEGRRMGGDKPLRLLAGRPLIAHACAGLSAPLAVARRTPGAAPLLPGTPEVFDPGGVEGPLAALIAGFDWARGEGADFVQTRPCDAPFLPPDLSARLFAAARDTGAAVILPRSLDRLHPACGLWRVDLAELARARARAGALSLVGLARAAGHAAVDWPASPGEDPFENLNTPDDLARARARVLPRQPQRE
jgi:molybdopterin-guanine dinucleotide biosynthesis protein A